MVHPKLGKPMRAAVGGGKALIPSNVKVAAVGVYEPPKLATSLPAGCAPAHSDGRACPPVPKYSREFLARAAGEVEKLPAGSAVELMLGDYGVVRAQARACTSYL